MKPKICSGICALCGIGNLILKWLCLKKYLCHKIRKFSTVITTEKKPNPLISAIVHFGFVSGHPQDAHGADVFEKWKYLEIQ